MAKKEKMRQEIRKGLQFMQIESVGVYCWKGKVLVFPHSDNEVLRKNAEEYIASMK